MTLLQLVAFVVLGWIAIIAIVALLAVIGARRAAHAEAEQLKRRYQEHS